MNLVNKEDGFFAFLQCSDNRLEPLFKISAEFCSGQQGTHIKGEEFTVFEQLGNLSFCNPKRQAFGHGGLTDTRLTDKDRIVFPAPAKNQYRSFQFLIASNQRINFPLFGPGNQINGKSFEGIIRFLSWFAAFSGGRLCRLLTWFFRIITDRLNMGNIIQQINPLNPLTLKKKAGVGIFFLEDGSKQITDPNLSLLRRLHMQDSALQHTLQGQGLARDIFFFGFFREMLKMRIKKIFQLRL